MVFVKGQSTKEFQEKAKKARNDKAGFAFCIVCQKEYKKYYKKQITCGSYVCKLKWTKARYDKTLGTLEGRAIRLFSTIKLGKGKKRIALQILSEFLGKPCKYCSVQINEENASVDHKIPKTHSKVKKGLYSAKEIRKLDSRDNLHIICRKCNLLKGNMNDEQYTRLNNFLKENKDLQDILIQRFNLNSVFFQRMRR